MYIKSVDLINFRNYEQSYVELDRGLNIIHGNNAAGKTNLVEAIYYAAFGKSPRVTNDRDLIRWGAESFNLRLNLSKRFRDYNIRVGVDGKAKKFYLDNIPITRIGDIVGLINVVFFSPDELEIVKGAPTARRKFLDMSISQQRKSYFTDLIGYNKVLDQRNKLLKTRLGDKETNDILSIYNIQLSRYGARIINNRYLFIDRLRQLAQIAHCEITDNQESLLVEYESCIERASVKDMESEMLRKLAALESKDRQLQYTSIGAHRDDIKLSVNDIDVRKFGSQGQMRTAALALKMSEVRLLEEENGELPILILDDVLSELDGLRAKKLLEMASNTQTLLTCTAYEGRYDKSLRVADGKVYENE